jgi:hypothetical protein
VSIRSVLNALKRVETRLRRLSTMSNRTRAIMIYSGQLITGRRSVTSIIRAKLPVKTAGTVTP